MLWMLLVSDLVGQSQWVLCSKMLWRVTLTALDARLGNLVGQSMGTLFHNALGVLGRSM
jgi:hypothetical protein